MVFKGRTVLIFILLAVFASSLVTMTIVNPEISAQRMNTGSNKDAVATAKQSELSKQDLNKLSTAYELIHSKYVTEVDHDKLLNGAINGMLGALDDPYSSYMDPKEAKQFEESINSSFQGIGAEVALEEGRVTIVAPIKGAPAEKAGIHVNDVIISVNGEKLDGLTLPQAVAKIRGVKGTQAKLSIMRAGLTEPVEIIVVRDDIPIETVFAEMITPEIGKIEIRQFSANTATKFKTELVALEGKGMKGLIIDVRDDPGGLLDRVVDIVQPFVAKGKPIVQIEDRQGNRNPTLSEVKEPVRTYPIAVLINGGSASASEILAGALKEAAQGKLFGETTYGKGTVQVTFEKEMQDGSNIKMTSFKWLTPNGNWIHKKGIEPDVKVSQPAYFKVAPFSKKNVLKADMANDDIKTLQIMLTALGLSTERTDGYFNDKTVLAVKAFQNLHKLPVTGEVDVSMMNKLEKEIVTLIKDPNNDKQLKSAREYIQNSIK